MAIRQAQPVSPPLETDKETLDDYSSVLQDNFKQLFQIAHRHTLRTTVPAANEGNVTDVFLVESGSTFSIYVKFPSGWKSVVVS
jgi:hypothetical protein